MNKFGITHENKELMKQIFDVVLKINMYTTHCAFVQFSGHVNWLEVSVRESKEHYNARLYDSRIALRTQDRTGEDLIETLEKLQQIETGEFDYESNHVS